MISIWDLFMDWICMYTFYLTQIECVDLRTQAQYNLTSRVKGDRAVRPKREAWDICGRFQVIKVTSLGMRIVLNCDTMTDEWWELCTFLQIYVYILFRILGNILMGQLLQFEALVIWLGKSSATVTDICHCFTQPQLEAKKIYTWKCVNSRQSFLLTKLCVRFYSVCRFYTVCKILNCVLNFTPWVK